MAVDGGGGGTAEDDAADGAVESISIVSVAAAAAATIAPHFGRARICSSIDGLAFCRNVSRSSLLTTPEPTTTNFELKLMLYGTPSGSTMPVVDTAFLGGMPLLRRRQRAADAGEGVWHTLFYFIHDGSSR